MVFFKKIEFWNRSGAWYRPSEWVFTIDRNCHNGCLIVELGWWGVSILKGQCRLMGDVR